MLRSGARGRTEMAMKLAKRRHGRASQQLEEHGAYLRERMTVSTCIHCGCNDMAACVDELGGNPCSWLVVDVRRQLGVCSACPEALARWNAGDRQPDAPGEA